MSQTSHYAKLLLLALTVLHLGIAAWWALADLQAANGLVYADGVTPVGGDFVNLFAAARLVLAGRSGEIYLPEAFMAFEQSIIPAFIGLRLWVYPPHSLLVIWPFGLLDFWPAFIAWSALGFGVLIWGARRAGFDRLETAIIALSPAALASLYWGQSGNVVAGLLLLALAGPAKGAGAPVSAALLTLKPQAGFLLPVLWLRERKYRAIAIAAGLTLVLLVLSLALFGLSAWRDYAGATLDALRDLEFYDRGPFLAMLPSVFAAIRLYADNTPLAINVHIVVAAFVAIIGIWRLWRTDEPRARWAIAIATMALVTPYIHIYDLAPVLAAALIVFARRGTQGAAAQAIAALVLFAVWALPFITMAGNKIAVPLGPLVLIALLILTLSPLSQPSPSSARTEKSPS